MNSKAVAYARPPTLHQLLRLSFRTNYIIIKFMK